MGELARVLVVGAGLAGLRAAEALRRRGYAGALTLLGAERHPPYDRPPLSKQVLAGERDPAELRYREPAALAALEITLTRGRAEALDLSRRAVRLDDRRWLNYDGLVLATGSDPVRLDLPGARLPGVHTLRTVDDAVALRDSFAAGPRVVVIGGGFIGSEVAATARQRGLPVTLVEALAAPLARVLGPQLGAEVARMHTDAGVDLRCGRSAAGFEGEHRVAAVRLDDGTRIPADLVLVAVGARPAVGWLAGSGLRLGDGVRCDAGLGCGPPRVVAAGDIASWPHPRFGRLRVEHWTNAAEQAAVAAGTLLDPAACMPYTGTPFVWTDLYGRRLQVVGRPSGGPFTIHRRDQASGRLLALAGRDGVLTAAAALDWPRPLMHYRNLIAAGAGWDEALASRPTGW